MRASHSSLRERRRKQGTPGAVVCSLTDSNRGTSPASGICDAARIGDVFWKQPYRADLTICKRCHTIGHGQFDDARRMQ
jgi:hypothetical protein